MQGDENEFIDSHSKVKRRSKATLLDQERYEDRRISREDFQQYAKDYYYLRLLHPLNEGEFGLRAVVARPLEKRLRGNPERCRTVLDVAKTLQRLTATDVGHLLVRSAPQRFDFGGCVTDLLNASR